ncbi:SGNH/GDSL hydrolase family protein [Microbacterium gilvum]|uniref:SGNH hydrolase-type esterase domain-containing protein n=1 Tax=Microbacterium gilvum TaxID=1336204 RepID=A0ABP8ZQS1_9MICO
MADVPGVVRYGRIVGRFVRYLADSTDPGSAPDEIPLNGTATIRALVPVSKWPTANPKRTAIAEPYVCPVIDGELYPPGTEEGALPAERGLSVISSFQPEGEPDYFQWEAKFRFDGVTNPPATTTFDVPDGGEIDLADFIPAGGQASVVTVVSSEDRVAAEDASATAVAAATTATAAASTATTSADTATAARATTLSARAEAVTAAEDATGAAGAATTAAGTAVVDAARAEAAAALVDTAPLRRAIYPASHPSGLIDVATTTTYTERRAQLLPVRAERFRVRVRNRDFLRDLDGVGTLTGLQLWIGEHKVTAAESMSGEFAATPVQVFGGVSLAGDAEYVSPWIDPADFEIRGGVPFLTSMRFTAPAGAKLAMGVGAHWTAVDAPAAAVSQLGAVGVFESPGSYLDVAIEYEARTAQPTVLVLSNSQAEGANGGGVPMRGELSSWPHKLMMATGALVSSLAVSGAWLAHFVDDSPKLAALGSDYEPDIVVLASLPSSDLNDDVPLADVKAHFAELVGDLRARWPRVRIVATTTLPRGDQGGVSEAVRRDWDAFLAKLPYGLEQVADPAAVLRAPERSRRGLVPAVPSPHADRVPNFALGATGTGGTFAAGTYFWTVTALNANGQTAPALEVSKALTAGQTQELHWDPVVGEPAPILYRVYRGTSSLAWDTWVGDVAPGTTSIVDTGASAGAATVPSFYNLTPDTAVLAPEHWAGTDWLHFDERGHTAVAAAIAPLLATSPYGTALVAARELLVSTEAAADAASGSQTAAAGSATAAAGSASAAGDAKTLAEAAAASAVTPVSSGNVGGASAITAAHFPSFRRLTVTAAVTFSLDTAGLPANRAVVAEVLLSMGATVYAVTWPAGIVWQDGVAPAALAANQRMLVQLVWTGAEVLGVYGGRF